MAKRYIQQFMWGFQDIFRGALESESKAALEAIGFYGNPRAILIGVQVAGEHEFSICIEQGEDQFKSSDLASLEDLAMQKYKNNPESQGIHSDRRAHEMRHNYLRNRARADVLEEVLGGLPDQEQRLFFAAHSVRVGDYEVHVIISVDKLAVDAVPQIKTTRRDRFAIRPSLLHAVLRRILSLAVKSLYFPEPGSNMEALEPKSSEVIRTATETFMRDIMYCAGHWFGSNADSLMNTLSALPYEGRAGSGRLVFAKSNNSAIDVAVKLRSIVNARETLAVRKLLEASGANADVLSDGDRVYGLGLVKSDYDPNTETVFVVTFASRGVWELSHAGVNLLTVKDGVPSLPKQVLDEEYFSSLLVRLLPNADKATLLEAARAAGKHRHGAMLVISADANAEAHRLWPQSWLVEPTRLSPELVTQLTDMDGAVLLDPTGHCHAIGVILDGTARGEGDPARGSRLNNAVRYLGSEPPPTIVIVYSADGGIDILPRLDPRVKKKDVDEVVAAYLALVVKRPPNYESASRAWDAVKAFEFYLTDAQCDALNDASNELEDWRMQNHGLRIEDRLVKPNPKMNDSYWI